MNKYNLNNKLYLVTGGSGFLGVPLVERLLNDGANVRILASDEGKLIEVKQKFPQVEILNGDISDLFEVRQAMKDVDGVFHLAASKHVGLAEVTVRETIKANTIGSMNILECSLDADLDFIIEVSGVYGALDLIYDYLENANDSSPYVPSMKAMSIENLLEAMYQKYLPEGGTKKIKTIGLQPGENFHEKILEDGEDSSQAVQYTVEEIIPLI